jgi:hypothetical protein
MKHLAPEVARIMRSTAKFAPDFANWLSGGRNIDHADKGVDAEKGRNRRQAIMAFPVLATEIFKYAERPDYINQMGSAIDNGQPLIPAMVASFGVKPATFKRVQGATWQRLGRSVFHAPGRHLDALDQMPPEHIPTTKRGMAELMSTYDAANQVAPLLDADSGEVFSSIATNYRKVAQDLEGNPADGVRDMANYIKNKVILPALIQKRVRDGENPDEVFQQCSDTHAKLGIHHARPLSGMTLRSALQASQRWHRALPRLENDLVTHRSNREWEPLTGPIELKDGITAHELHSKRSLSIEGIMQNHCVGGYDGMVVDGVSMIYSVRKGEKTLSTVELHPQFDEPGKRPAVIQNFGYGNSTAPAEAKKAVRQLVSHVHNIPVEQREAYRAKLVDVRASAATSPREKVIEDVGYDPLDRKQLEKSWEGLKEFLPKPMRKLGLDGFAEKMVEGISSKQQQIQQAQQKFARLGRRDERDEDIPF